MTPRPALPPDAPDAARRALAALNDLGDAEQARLYDPSLSSALQPLRAIAPVPVECGRCHRGIAFWALEPEAAIVAACQRRAPVERRSPGGTAALSRREPHPAGSSKAAWIEEAETGTTTVTLVDNYTPGYPVRLNHTCPKCRAQYVLTNTRRLRQLLTALSSRSSRIVL